MEKLAPSPLVASPSKRHLPADDSDMVGMPRSKRLMLSGSPVKMASGVFHLCVDASGVFDHRHRGGWVLSMDMAKFSIIIQVMLSPVLSPCCLAGVQCYIYRVG